MTRRGRARGSANNTSDSALAPRTRSRSRSASPGLGRTQVRTSPAAAAAPHKAIQAADFAVSVDTLVAWSMGSDALKLSSATIENELTVAGDTIGSYNAMTGLCKDIGTTVGMAQGEVAKLFSAISTDKDKRKTGMRTALWLLSAVAAKSVPASVPIAATGITIDAGAAGGRSTASSENLGTPGSGAGSAGPLDECAFTSCKDAGTNVQALGFAGAARKYCHVHWNKPQQCGACSAPYSRAQGLEQATGAFRCFGCAATLAAKPPGPTTDFVDPDMFECGMCQETVPAEDGHVSPSSKEFVCNACWEMSSFGSSSKGSSNPANGKQPYGTHVAVGNSTRTPPRSESAAPQPHHKHPDEYSEQDLKDMLKRRKQQRRGFHGTANGRAPVYNATMGTTMQFGGSSAGMSSAHTGGAAPPPRMANRDMYSAPDGFGNAALAGPRVPGRLKRKSKHRHRSSNRGRDQDGGNNDDSDSDSSDWDSDNEEFRAAAEHRVAQQLEQRGAVDADGLIDLEGYSPQLGAAMSRRFEEKIIKGKIDIDMIDVLANSHGGASKRKSQRDVRLSKEAWVEAWRLVARVLVTYFSVPQHVVDAYQTFMEQLFNDYRKTYPQGPAKYDALYRAKAATLFRSSNRLPNFRREAVIFNQVFAGKRVATCSMCGSPDHLPMVCSLIAADDDSDNGGGASVTKQKKKKVKTIAKGDKGDKGAKGKGKGKGKNNHNACHDHNDGKCTFDPCKFEHVCSFCGADDHVESDCPSK